MLTRYKREEIVDVSGVDTKINEIHLTRAGTNYLLEGDVLVGPNAVEKLVEDDEVLA